MTVTIESKNNANDSDFHLYFKLFFKVINKPPTYWLAV